MCGKLSAASLRLSATGAFAKVATMNEDPDKPIRQEGGHDYLYARIAERLRCIPPGKLRKRIKLLRIIKALQNPSRNFAGLLPMVCRGRTPREVLRGVDDARS